ncbi:MAG: single-stranded DNA-binding protein, partial [Bacteroidota bacterium]
GLADIVERYVRKGTKLYIEGKLTTRSYESEGITKYLTEIRALQILLLDSRQGGEGGIPLPPEPMQATQSSAPAQAKTTGDNSFSTNDTTDEDDLPF